MHRALFVRTGLFAVYVKEDCCPFFYKIHGKRETDKLLKEFD